MGTKQISVRANDALLQRIDAAIDAKMEAANGVKCDAAGLAFEELFNGNVDGSSEKLQLANATIQELNLRLEKLQEDWNSLEEAYSALSTDHELIQPWVVDETLGAVAFALISDSTVPEVTDMASFAEYILKPYWRQGALEPDETDRENFRNIITFKKDE